MALLLTFIACTFDIPPMDGPSLAASALLGCDAAPDAPPDAAATASAASPVAPT